MPLLWCFVHPGVFAVVAKVFVHRLVHFVELLFEGFHFEVQGLKFGFFEGIDLLLKIFDTSVQRAFFVDQLRELGRQFLFLACRLIEAGISEFVAVAVGFD
jgi:hypothetical protein